MPGTIYGALNLNDNDERLVNTIGHQTVWDAVQSLLDEFNEELRLARGVFVEEDTTLLTEAYKLPGGGYLQELTNIGQPAARKVEGEWEVAYPLFNLGDQIADNEIELAYMTLAEFQRHLDAVWTRGANSMRREILRALFPNVNFAVKDQTAKLNLTVKPLANGDSDKYSPKIGEEALTTENHYLVSGYAAADISETNDPIETLTDHLEEHFGGGAIAGADVVCFINKAQRAKVQALPNFTNDGLDTHTEPGTGVTTVVGLPQGLPGKVIGTAGAWIVEWNYVPAGYMKAIHLRAAKPLKRRVDPADVGLGSGDLQLVQKDKVFPLQSAFYRHRYGFGAANRLNGVIMQLKADGAYEIPAIYKRVP